METTIVWSRALPPVDGTVLARIEKRLGVRFPQEYATCALKNHGGRPSMACLDFGGKKDRSFRSLLALVKDAKKTYLLDAHDWVRDRLPDGVIPFGDHPAGDFYCFDYRSGDLPSVVYWDHELALSKPDDSIIFVSNSFADLLRMLHACPE